MFQGFRLARLTMAASIVATGLLPVHDIKAQTPSSEDTLAITTGIIDGLRQLFPGGSGRPALSWDEVVFGVPDDDTHAVTLRGIYIDEPDGTVVGLDEMQLAVEIVADGTYAFETVLPTRVVWADQAGNPILTANVDGQRFNGVWSRPFNTFLQLDLLFDEIEVTAADQPPRLSVENLAVTLDLNQDDGTRYSGPGTFTFGDLEVSGLDGSRLASFDELGLAVTFSRIDLAGVNAFTQQIEAMGRGVDPFELLALIEASDDLVGGTQIALSASDVMAVNPDDGVKGMVGSLRFGLDIQGLDGDETEFSVDYGHDGLATEPPPGSQDVVPASAAFAVAMATLPKALLFETARSALQVLFVDGPYRAEALSIAQDGLDAATDLFDNITREIAP